MLRNIRQRIKNKIAPSAPPVTLSAIPSVSPVNRPKHVDWTLNEGELLERIKGAITERHGHVYSCIENFLPQNLYEACVAFWPREDQFEPRTHSRRRLTLATIPEAPIDDEQRAFWHKFGNELINGKIKPLVIKAYTPYMDRKFDWLSPEELADLQKDLYYVHNLHEGLNADKDFALGPHIDQNYIFVGSMLYLPPDRSQLPMGTTLFEALDPNMRAMDTVYGDMSKLRAFTRFPFAPNTLGSWLQAPLAYHGYIGQNSPSVRRTYQFNIHMDEDTIMRAYGDKANTAPYHTGINLRAAC